MIVYRKWFKGHGNTIKTWEGWFFLGFIPIYIAQTNYRGYPEGYKF